MSRELLTAIGLEGLYQTFAEQLLRAGVPWQREQFLTTAGYPIMFPATVIEVLQEGGGLAGWQPLIHVAQVMARAALNAGN